MKEMTRRKGPQGVVLTHSPFFLCMIADLQISRSNTGFGVLSDLSKSEPDQTRHRWFLMLVSF